MGPASAGRRLRTTLREIRLSTGMSEPAVGQALGWPHTRLPGIEAGENGIGLGCLRSLLAHYRVIDSDQVDQLVTLQRLARQRHWADTYQQFYSPPFLTFLRFEGDAEQIQSFHPRLVPGLLQTEAYARVIIHATAAHPVTYRDVEARVRARIRRQRAILTGDHRVQVALTEPALLRPVSDDTTIMAAQLDHLITLTQTARVDLTVLPAESGRHPGTDPFVILRFDSTQDPDLVYRDDTPPDTALDDTPTTVDQYLTTFADLRAGSVSGQQAITRLTEIRQQHQ